MELWQEYCAAQTPEAKYVKDLDKLELILQADEYEATQNVDLQQFFDNTQNIFKTETGYPSVLLFHLVAARRDVSCRKAFAKNVRSQRENRMTKNDRTNHQ